MFLNYPRRKVDRRVAGLKIRADSARVPTVPSPLLGIGHTQAFHVDSTASPEIEIGT
ncbi:MAG: hypothetical protein ACFCUG_10280 [Thiotrichales bacterium]